MGSAEAIGRQREFGSLESGRYADLLILDKNPLLDIRNTLSLREVMKNGRLYDAQTLDRSEEPRLNSSHSQISYAVFCLKKKTIKNRAASDQMRDSANMPRPNSPACTCVYLRTD